MNGISHSDTRSTPGVFRRSAAECNQAMKTSLILLTLTFKLFAQSIVIDCGGPTDTGFSGATTAYTIPAPVPVGISDSTMRYGQYFTYHLSFTGRPGLYALVLGFVEPSVQGPGQRIFSVAANDQPIVANIDLFAEAGYLVSTTRSAVVYLSGTDLCLVFSASVRNAVISSITATALGFGSVTLPVFVTSEVPVGAINGVNTGFTLAFIPSALQLFRNGLLQTLCAATQTIGCDYLLAGNGILFQPVGGVVVPVVGDTILASYWH